MKVKSCEETLWSMRYLVLLAFSLGSGSPNKLDLATDQLKRRIRVKIKESRFIRCDHTGTRNKESQRPHPHHPSLSKRGAWVSLFKRSFLLPEWLQGSWRHGRGKTRQRAGTTGLGPYRDHSPMHTSWHQTELSKFSVAVATAFLSVGVCERGHSIEQEPCGHQKTTSRFGPYLPPCLGTVYVCCCLPRHTPGQQAHELPGNPLLTSRTPQPHRYYRCMWHCMGSRDSNLAW